MGLTCYSLKAYVGNQISLHIGHLNTYHPLLPARTRGHAYPLTDTGNSVPLGLGGFIRFIRTARRLDQVLTASDHITLSTTQESAINKTGSCLYFLSSSPK